MSLFKKRKSDIIDWSSNQRREPKVVVSPRKSSYPNSFSSSSSNFNKPSPQESSGGAFSIFGGADVASTAKSSSSPNYVDFSGSSGSSNNSDNSEGEAEDRRKKLTKRIMDMTDRLEELSNQMYKLQQRVELLERKADLGR
jgi:hypothetical protein